MGASASVASVRAPGFHSWHVPSIREPDYDPRTVFHQSRVSLRAKAAVVDDDWVLITSANFTDRGQTRNLEIGVVVRDPSFAAAVTEKLRRLQVLGLFREMTR